MGDQQVSGYCPLCISRCGCVAIVRDGILVELRADPAHPTGSALCIKGRSAPDLVYSPERLRVPLRRTNPKDAADPGWTPIKWDDALDMIEEKIAAAIIRNGPESVAFGVTTPSGTAIADSFLWINRLAHAIGSANIVFATENCNWHKDFSTMDTLGCGIGMPDYEHSGCVVLWGFNPSTSWLAHAAEVVQAKRRGAKLIVVDPRKSGLANAADLWLGVRPGTDGILAMAIAGVMIEHQWFDYDFILRWSNGPFLVRADNTQLLTEADLIEGGSPKRYMVWSRQAGCPVGADELEESHHDILLFDEVELRTRDGFVTCYTAFEGYARACTIYAPEAAEVITGVSAAEIRGAAELLYSSGPVAYYTWAGTAQHSDSAQTGRALSLLFALTGYIDAPGGNVQFTKPPLSDLFGLDLLTETQRRKCLGYAERPLGPGRRGWITSRDLYRAIVEKKPYPIKALISFGGNPLLTKPDTSYAKAALGCLDFYVHADMFLNPTAQYADLVLPVASPWEREGLAAGFLISQWAERRVQLRPKVIEPVGEARDDVAIVFELARRLGVQNRFFDGDYEAALTALLKPSGLTPAQLRRQPEGVELPLETQYYKYLQKGFNTPSGRLEMYAQRYAECGYAPWPVFDTAHADTFPLYRLRLTSHKTVPYCHSQHRQLPALRRRIPDPQVEMNPYTAAVRGIGEGAWVRIVTAHGSLFARAVFRSSLRPEVISAQYGWWQPCVELGVPGYAIDGPDNHNFNSVIGGGQFDPISGSNGLKSCDCEVVLAEPDRIPLQ